MNFTTQELNIEAKRLFKNLKQVGWSMDECLLYAPITLEINILKKEQDAVILAHSYQTPDIVYGVSDFVGDSYGLSLKVQNLKAKKIIFSSVLFMAETAKILNPKKQVFVPKKAGCSLASSIRPNDVRKLRKEHPGIPVVCYINTTADVKAECDICVTSSNALNIIEKLDSNKIIFIPDKYMARNIQNLTNKEIITWDGVCIVHEEFSVKQIKEIRELYPKAKILAHTECTPEVISKVDLAGGTNDMINYIETSKAKEFMLVTECGLTDRMKVEFKERKFIGSCSLCPYMKKISLKDILQVLKNPKKSQIVDLDQETIKKAKKCLDKMFELAN